MKPKTLIDVLASVAILAGAFGTLWAHFVLHNEGLLWKTIIVMLSGFVCLLVTTLRDPHTHNISA